MRAGDRWAFRRLLANVHGLVVKTADRHIPRYWRSRRGRRSEKHTNKLFFEDLVAEACGAVWRAVPGFDLDGGYRFWTYAQQRVAGAISDAARKWRRGGSGGGRLDRWLYSHPHASPEEVLAARQRLLKRPIYRSLREAADAITQFPEHAIAIEQMDFSAHWPRIGGMDFGWDHPFAAVELVWDRESDVVYVRKTHRLKEATPIIHAAALRSWGKELPWAWPRDGRRETLEGAGVALAEQYRAQGLNMLPKHAQFEDGGVSVEAGLMAMLTRMQMGKLKVFKHLNDWFEEFRLYHRRDGKVVKEGDDLMAATRYGIMMLRFASTKATYDKFRRPIEYPKIKYV
jgi:hypothetical protein